MKTGNFLISVGTLLILILGIKATLAQLEEFSMNDKSRMDDRATKYFDELRTGDNKAIAFAIEHNKSILAPKGKFSTDKLDDYLNDIDDVGASYDTDLLDEYTVCRNFYDTITELQNNTEVQNYISNVRSKNNDNSYFANIDTLEDIMPKC